MDSILNATQQKELRDLTHEARVNFIKAIVKASTDQIVTVDDARKAEILANTLQMLK